MLVGKFRSGSTYVKHAYSYSASISSFMLPLTLVPLVVADQCTRVNDLICLIYFVPRGEHPYYHIIKSTMPIATGLPELVSVQMKRTFFISWCARGALLCSGLCRRGSI